MSRLERGRAVLKQQLEGRALSLPVAVIAIVTSRQPFSIRIRRDLWFARRRLRVVGTTQVAVLEPRAQLAHAPPRPHAIA